MKKILLLILAVATIGVATAQSYNAELNYLGQYVQRMYVDAPFLGARVISDVDKCYLICVIEEQLPGNDYATQRKAEVKAMRYANEFINGAHISSNSVVYTKKTSDGRTFEEIEDFIASRSMGYIQQMQVLTTFSEQGKKVFVYCKELPMPKQQDASESQKKKKNKRKR